MAVSGRRVGKTRHHVVKTNCGRHLKRRHFQLRSRRLDWLDSTKADEIARSQVGHPPRRGEQNHNGVVPSRLIVDLDFEVVSTSSTARLCIPSEFHGIPAEYGKKAPAGTECVQMGTGMRYYSGLRPKQGYRSTGTEKNVCRMNRVRTSAHSRHRLLPPTTNHKQENHGRTKRVLVLRYLIHFLAKSLI